LHQVGDLFELNVKLRCQKVNEVVSSWWWAWRRPKHVERHKMSSNKLEKLLHLVG